MTKEKEITITAYDKESLPIYGYLLVYPGDIDMYVIKSVGHYLLNQFPQATMIYIGLNEES